MRNRAARAGIELNSRAVREAVERLKEREHRGYQYEAANASFELLLRRESGAYRPLFRLESFRVSTEKRADRGAETEATIEIRVRVLLDSTDGGRTWGTIGVSENIIEASWEALVESLDYAFQPRAAADEESVAEAGSRRRNCPG